MAYDEFLADRIRSVFKRKNIPYIEKRMMGGLCFMVDDKMCCGLHYDKKKEMDLMMVRIGEETYEKVQFDKGCLPMDFTGRRMKGYAFVNADGFDSDEDLDSWVQLCIDFNPQAKKSKKRK